MLPSQHDGYQLAVNAGLAKEWLAAFKAGESTKLIEEIAATGKRPTAAKVAPSAVAPAAPTKVGEESGKAPSGAVIGAPITSDKSVKPLAPVNTGGEQGESAAKPAVSPAAAAESSALAPRAAPAAAAPALASNRFAFNPSAPSFVSSGATLSGSTAPSGMMSKEALALQTSERDLAKNIAEKNVQGAIDAAGRVQQAQLNFDRELAIKENEKRIALELEGEKTVQKEDLERKAEIRTKADVGKTARNLARQFRAISEDPSADKILGAFSNNSVFSAIVNLAESGIGIKGYSIGIQDLSPILRNLNLDPKEMQKAQIMGMLIAQMQLSKGKMLSGNTSNYDLALMGQSGVTDKDTRLTVRAKADMIERQAQYHADLEEMLEDWKGTMSAFNRSKKVTELSDKFNNDLTDIINGKLKYSNPAKAAPAKAAASGDKKPAGKRNDDAALKKLLGGD
jgi:hypothetical protein